MTLSELKEITKAANTITFALAKMINNYSDIIGETAANGWMSKGDLLQLLEYDPFKNLITLKKDFNSKVFDIVERQRNFNAMVDGEKVDISKMAKDLKAKIQERK